MKRTSFFRPLHLTLEHLWFLAPFFVIVIRAFRTPLPLLDFWWHLKMGEIIVYTGSIPRTDLFSFTAAGKPFVVQNWLAEVLYYSTYLLGGLPLMLVLNTALLTAALVPVFLLCRESTNSTRLAALAALLTCVAFVCNARPQVFSVLFFALFYWILDGYRSGRRDYLWLMPVLMVFWVNLHGAFVVGLGLFGIVLTSESIMSLTNPAQERALSVKQLRKLALVFIAALAGTMVNPETYGVYDYVRLVTSDQASQQLVMEWQPPRINTVIGVQMFFGIFALAVAGLICSRKRPNLTDLALFLSFSIFGLTALRNTVWSAIVVSPILVRYWSAIEFSGSLEPLKRFVDPSSKRGNVASSYPRTSILNTVLAFIAVASIIASSPWLRRIQSPASLFDSRTPIRAVDYMKYHGLQGHIFHPQIFGDYLVWRLYPQQRSFIDGRVHLFGEGFVHEYRNIFHDSLWEERLSNFGIRYLLLSKDEEQSDSRLLAEKAYASSNWTILFEDKVSVLFAQK